MLSGTMLAPEDQTATTCRRFLSRTSGTAPILLNEKPSWRLRQAATFGREHLETGDDNSRTWDLTRFGRGIPIIVCAGPASRVAQVVRDTGLETIVVTNRSIDAIDRSVALQPRLAVIELTATGQMGLRVIPALRAVAPDCAVVLITPFRGSNHAAAMDAGAYAVLGEDDLRSISRIVEQLAMVDRAPTETFD